MITALLLTIVISITDGDTLTALHDNQQIKTRLAEIDAPERQATLWPTLQIVTL